MGAVGGEVVTLAGVNGVTMRARLVRRLAGLVRLLGSLGAAGLGSSGSGLRPGSTAALVVTVTVRGSGPVLVGTGFSGGRGCVSLRLADLVFVGP